MFHLSKRRPLTVAWHCIFQIDRKKCAGSEEAVIHRLQSISEQWEILTHKTSEKSMKLKEANRQRTFIAAIKDLDFWLGEVESLLNTDDHGKDLASVQNLMKKHDALDSAVDDYSNNVRQLGEAARQLIAEGHPDSEQISVRLAQVKVIEDWVICHYFFKVIIPKFMYIFLRFHIQKLIIIHKLKILTNKKNLLK